MKKILCAGILLGLICMAHADIVSINVGKAPNVPLIGTELVGAPGSQDAADNWINAATATAQAASTGSVTDGGITVSYSANHANGVVSVGGSEDNVNSIMMATYMAMNNDGGTFVTISGLGSAFTTSGYNLIVYCQSDTTRTHGLKATDNAANTDSEVSGETNVGYYEANGYDANNVVVLTGFTGDTVTLTRDANNGGVPQITGIQVQSISEPEPEPATILSITPLSGNIMKMVINAPSPGDLYWPKARPNLVVGSWDGVAHSVDGVAPWHTTNLSYVSEFESETNVVIYVQAEEDEKFFRIDN